MDNWEKEFDEIRDKAIAYYEEKCDVHSETNFVALLNAFGIFQPFLKQKLQEVVAQDRKELREKVEGMNITDIGYKKTHVDTLEDIRRKEGYNQALQDIIKLL